jgi:hypothetical protein
LRIVKFSVGPGRLPFPRPLFGGNFHQLGCGDDE